MTTQTKPKHRKLRGKPANPKPQKIKETDLVLKKFVLWGRCTSAAKILRFIINLQRGSLLEKDGQVWVAIKRKTLEEYLDLSEAQVRRNIARLCKEGFLHATKYRSRWNGTMAYRPDYEKILANIPKNLLRFPTFMIPGYPKLDWSVFRTDYDYVNILSATKEQLEIVADVVGVTPADLPKQHLINLRPHSKKRREQIETLGENDPDQDESDQVPVYY